MRLNILRLDFMLVVGVDAVVLLWVVLASEVRGVVLGLVVLVLLQKRRLISNLDKKTYLINFDVVIVNDSFCSEVVQVRRASA